MVHLREILARYPRTARTRLLASGRTWMVVLVQVDRDEPPPTDSDTPTTPANTGAIR